MSRRKAEKGTVDDVSRLAELTRVIYGRMWKRAGDADYYRWKLFSQGRPEPISWVTRQDEAVIGHLASWHRQFRFGNHKTWSSELCDAMAHPDYRRQGIWETVSARTIGDAVDGGYFPVYATPNRLRTSYKGFTKKLSMTHLFNIWHLMLPLSRFPAMFSGYALRGLALVGIHIYSAIRRICHRVSRVEGLNVIVESRPSIEEWVNELWREEQAHHEAGIVKDEDYLRWRFDENPDHYQVYRARDDSGKILGILVTKTRSQDDQRILGSIADVMVPSRNAQVLSRLLEAAEADFIKCGVILVDAWSTSHPFYFRRLISYGFIPARIIALVVPEKQAAEIAKGGWADGRKWVFTMADSDNV